MTSTKITPATPPQFPCWLWDSRLKRWENKSVLRPDRAFTHWHPDQPTAPTSSPGETTKQLNQNTKDMIVSGEKYQAFDSPGETGGEALPQHNPIDEANAPKHPYPLTEDQRLQAVLEKMRASRAAQSQTPMTDAVTKGCKWNGVYSELVAHAESLETALAAAKEELAKAGVGQYKGDYYLGRVTETGALRAKISNLRERVADRDALAEKLRRVEGEMNRIIDRCDGRITQTDSTDGPGERKVADMQARLAALQQQVGEADKLAEALETILEDLNTGDKEMIPHSKESGLAALSAWASSRLARQPDHGQST